MSARPQHDSRGEAAPAQTCSFCAESPTGPTGHEGLALQVHKLPPTVRTLICVSCFFCGTRWARKRLNAREFQWHRVVG